MATEHMDAVRRVFDSAWNQGALQVLDEVYSETVLSHPNGPTRETVCGLEEIKNTISSMRATFGDLRVIIEDLREAGDQVVCRWRAEGLQRRTVMGVPPTGRRVEWGGISIFAFEGGRIREEWWAYDEFCVFQALTEGAAARSAGA